LLFTQTFAYTVSGKVETDQKSPVTRVDIRLESIRNNRPSLPVFNTQTDTTGNFIIENIPTGNYQMTVSKKGWITWRNSLTLKIEEGKSELLEMTIELQLTRLYQVLTFIQLGSVIYITFFGLLILTLNFLSTGKPGKELTLVGWLFIGLSIGVAFVKWKLLQAAQLAFFGVLIGGLIQKSGKKQANLKWQQEKEVQEKRELVQKQEQEEIQKLIGQEGVAFSELKPYGNISIQDKILEAKTRQGLLSKGSRVVVKSVEGRTLVVELLKD
ncbi:MAG: carboxypeptidase regulatory-like domain-containing protein, partial [Planctomycetota bacterium]